jgi:hypothetical protein
MPFLPRLAADPIFVICHLLFVVSFEPKARMSEHWCRVSLVSNKESDEMVI